MAANAERKEHPISMRLPEADIAMIDRAAEDVLMENRLIRMSPEGFADFMAVLSGPATPAPEMVELSRRPAPWEPGYAPRS